MSAADLVTAATILAGAGWLLYRSLWRKGPCHGCTSGGCAARGRTAPGGLVKLGVARRR